MYNNVRISIYLNNIYYQTWSNSQMEKRFSHIKKKLKTFDIETLSDNREKSYH